MNDKCGLIFGFLGMTLLSLSFSLRVYPTLSLRLSIFGV